MQSGACRGWRYEAIVAVLACMACGPSPRTDDSQQTPAEPVAILPLISAGGLPFIRVETDSSAPHLWLLDSGFETSVVNRRYADSLRLPTYVHDEATAPGGHTDVGVVAGIPLHLGQATFRPESLAVIDLHHVEPIVGLAYAGILGHDFFTRYVTRIDYDRRVVELFAPSQFTYRGPGRTLPVWIEADQPFALALLYLNGRAMPAKLKLDTGSLDVLGLNGSFVQQAELTRGVSRRLPALGAGIGGKVAGYVIRLDSLTIASITVAQPIAAYSAEVERGGDAGTVGVGLLSRFNLVFDYARRRVILEPTARMHAPMGYDASGLLLTGVGPSFRGIAVLWVDHSSPADTAGVQPGDILIAIDSQPWAKLGLSGVRERLSQPGTNVSLTFLRRGEERHVVLRLRARL
jgi:hypothetical protein